MYSYDGDLCICPACGARIPHKRGYPCFREHCPACGSVMQRHKGGADLAGLKAAEAVGQAKVMESFPQVIAADCISCGICIDACSFDAIHFVDGKAKIDRDQCTRCGECMCICPRNAIRDKSGKGC